MIEFLRQLRQRKLVQWLLAYIAMAFAVIQGVDVVAQRFGWPASTMRYLILALAVGFSIVITAAWYHGERGAQHVGGAELLIIALLLAIGGGLIGHFAPTPATATRPSSTAVATAAPVARSLRGPQGVAATSPTGNSPPAPAAESIPAKSIAVLPFESLSSDKDNAYFAAGMQDLILTKLADIGDLKVVARTATANLTSHPDDLHTISRRLGVATFLEGSVQKAGRQVLINVQLIDAQTDAHIWAQTYTRTLDNIFGVEGEVADKVAKALDARLTSSERKVVGKLPTNNPRAYDAFLRARYFDNEAGNGAFLEYVPQVIAAYEKAVAEDPNFALAWAGLSNARFDARYWGVDHSEANLQPSEDAAKKALALDPQSADAHLAMAGVARFTYRDFDKARDEDQRAITLRPNDSDAVNDLAINEAHLGDLAASLAAMRQTIALDPTDSFAEFDLGLFLAVGGHYDAARAALHKALALNPQSAIALVLSSKVEVLQGGNVPAAIDIVDHVSPGTPVNADVAAQRIVLRLYQRDYTTAGKLAAEYSGKFKSGPGSVTLAMSRADVEWLAGDEAAARDRYRDAIKLITAPGMDIGAEEHMALALANARVGQGAAAMRNDAAARAIDRHSHDVGYIEAERIANRAKVRLALGDASGAIDNLARCLARSDCGLYVSPALLRLDPTWDSLRKDPRFQALQGKDVVVPVAPASSTGEAND